MNDLVPSLLVIVVCTAALLTALGRFNRWEHSWLVGALAAHYVAGIAQVVVVTQVYGGGDMLMYAETGSLLSQFLMEYPLEGGVRTLQIILHQPGGPIPVSVVPGSTGAMQAISGFVMLFAGDSLYAACLICGGATFFSKLALYRVFRRELDERFRRLALVSCLLVPSVVFWSSALLKEAVAIAGLNVAAYGGYAMATGRRPVIGTILLGAGMGLASVVKAYVILPFGAAAGVWFFLDGARPEPFRRLRQIRPVPLLVGVGIAVGTIVAIGELFPRFNPSGLAEEAADLQGAVHKTAGGSNYTIGDPAERSFAGQLAFAPFAVLTALFRPVVFEVRNPQMGLSALETTVALWLLVKGLLRSGAMGFVRAGLGSPILAFCGTYAAALALGVGLATTNLGTLSRYRIPFVPFLFVMLGVLGARRRGALGENIGRESGRRPMTLRRIQTG